MFKLRFVAFATLIGAILLSSCKKDEVSPVSKDAGTIGRDGTYSLVKIDDRRPSMDTVIINPVDPILSVCPQLEVLGDSLIDCEGASFPLNSAIGGWDIDFLGDTLFLKSTDSFQGSDDYDMWYLK